MGHQPVTIRSHGKREVLKLVYEPETWDRSDNGFTAKLERDLGEDSDKEDIVYLC